MNSGSKSTFIGYFYESMTFLSDVILLYNYRLSFSPSKWFQIAVLGEPIKEEDSEHDKQIPTNFLSLS